MDYVFRPVPMENLQMLPLIAVTLALRHVIRAKETQTGAQAVLSENICQEAPVLRVHWLTVMTACQPQSVMTTVVLQRTSGLMQEGASLVKSTVALVRQPRIV